MAGTAPGRRRLAGNTFARPTNSLYNPTMTPASMSKVSMSKISVSRVSQLCGVAIAALVLNAPAGHAQVAPIPYLNSFGAAGLNGVGETQFWGSEPDEDGFRKGFSFRSFSMPVAAFGSGLPFGAQNFNFSGLTSTGAQYGYSFKGVGDMPVTLFGGVATLKSSPDVFTSLVTPGFERNNTLATSVSAGIEFKPTSNISLSLSGSFVQPSVTTDTDLRSQLISGARR